MATEYWNIERKDSEYYLAAALLALSCSGRFKIFLAFEAPGPKRYGAIDHACMHVHIKALVLF